jgi:flagellar biosynthesis protein FliP
MSAIQEILYTVIGYTLYIPFMLLDTVVSSLK